MVKDVLNRIDYHQILYGKKICKGKRSLPYIIYQIEFSFYLGSVISLYFPSRYTSYKYIIHSLAEESIGFARDGSNFRSCVIY